MISISGWVLSRDIPVVRIEDGLVTSVDTNLAPLYFLHFKDFTAWLESRAIDSHRTNSRLLKKALRLANKDDASTALAVNAVTITDTYWFKKDGEDLTWSDVKFSENYFDKLALRGDPDSFSNKPSRTPELTNTGSFEKCWRLIDGKWWMYKSGNDKEYFSELFICQLGKAIGFNMAEYQYDDGYVRTLDFTDSAKINFEHISSVMGDNEFYEDNFEYFLSLSPEIAEDYLRLIYLDTICYNMDRHTSNYGLFRDVESGKIFSLAPNYDNNIALISNGYPSDISRQKDGIIRMFTEFLSENPIALDMFCDLDIPNITEDVVNDCLDKVPIAADRQYIVEYILNGQSIIQDFIDEQGLNESDSITPTM